MEKMSDKSKQPDTGTSILGRNTSRIDFAVGRLPERRGLPELLPQQPRIVHRQILASPSGDYYRASGAEALQDKHAIKKSLKEFDEIRIKEKNSKKNILVLFTGGTIGSIKLPDGTIVQPSEAKKRGFDVGDAKSLLLDEYQKKYPNHDSNTKFHTKILMETLSENMTREKWETLTKELKKLNGEFEQYKGIVLTHGSDTLGYTTNYLSTILAGIKVPMIIVSSNFVLTDEKSNGIKNFKGAVDFISHVQLPGVYVTYHSKGKTKLIHGSRVGQCKPITDDFDSISIGEVGEKNMRPLGHIKEDGSFEALDTKLFKNLKVKSQDKSQDKRDNLLDRVESLDAQILVIEPHIGLDYNNFNLDNVDAVLHKTYHSGTACMDGKNENLLEFAKKCREKGVDLYLGPIYGDEGRDVYHSTAEYYKSGGLTIMNVSTENAHSKLLIAYSLFKGAENKKNRDKIIYENINEEFVKKSSRLKRGSGSTEKDRTA
jgi:L-asparaginase